MSVENMAIDTQDIIETHFQQDDQLEALIREIGEDPVRHPLHTLDEIRPSLISVPDNVMGLERIKLETEGRRLQALYDNLYFDLDSSLLDPKKRLGSGEFAFLIHARDLSDVALQFPYLSTEYLGENEIKDIFKTIPPFRASRITGLKDVNGEELRGWVVIASILPEQLLDRGELRSVKENILQVSKLAYMLGADIVGLGAMSAMLTHYGKDIEEKLLLSDEDGEDRPALRVTTGHSYTSFLLKETLNQAAEKTGQDLSRSTVAVIGAAGSIGRTAAHLCFSEVGKMVLLDTKVKESKVNEFVSTERQRHSTEVEVWSVAGLTDPVYQHALRGADFVICATTAVEPFVKKEWLKPGVVVIDDSAPVNIAEGEAEAIGGMTLHVVANIPEGFRWNFPMTLADASFGCGAEVATLAGQHRLDLSVAGEVTPESVRQIALAAKVAGFTIGPLQSFGKLKTALDFERIKSSRRQSAA